MINKRLLIKNLLAHNDENSFYDKKRQLNLHNQEGKAKFLKHICALSNSNPNNNSYLVIGVEDESNEIVGDDFFDDSRIQNLVNAFLQNPPKIQYENIPFPNLPKEKVVGLVTIKPNHKVSYFKKSINTIELGSTFKRIGSNTVPTHDKIPYSKQNTQTVISIENNSRNSVEHTLESVLDFINVRHKDMETQYKVFKELFIVCWAGNKKEWKDKTYFSRVDIELINEQIKLFYSALDEVTIEYSENNFMITEFIQLGINDKTSYYPLEKVNISFFDNGYYKIENEVVFEPPQFNKKLLHHVYKTNLLLLEKLSKEIPLTNKDLKDLENLPHTLMLCYLNGFEDAKQKLIASKPFLKHYQKVYITFKEALRVLRKMKYNQ
ncbi:MULTISPECIES: ATP-binding protein [Flavobacterium]|uniref:ATP-binding protein n=2 Tax=Flavobacterium TaxID=237 RepID=A0AA94F1X0_9FLAO|nr:MULTISPECIES: ATP-binding protein [Flavobacterium]OXA82766.1 AAA family ATPase [Flavobacterium columnare] [Flavobacterium columnare NBRC 100251 = ATCC 23463]AMA48167.1 AAA family ATPase [Flavobacterium covae]AND63695.1 AAA family ATPase [Flavobacterium covae]MCH4830079.1 ATP-binding protein [Flavobacterium columnare]MCH4832541.1 ATP-binding protein [Flavobacterium columnare]